MSAFLPTAALALAGCMGAEDGVASAELDCGRATSVSSDFESGNIGEVQKLADTEWVLSLPDDNDNPNLPDNWRTWWYVRFDGVSTAEPLAVTVNNNVWPYYYVPVYSYDQRVWHRFEESEVTQPDASSTKMVKRFDRSTVWLARFYPYTFTDLQRYLDRVDRSRFVSREVVGTTQLGNPLEVVTITDPSVPQAGKRRIWLHGRSHPAETGSSFLLEGLIDLLLSRDPDAEVLRASFVFSILPMHNIDGVIAGNYRTTPASQNLENLWLRDPADPFLLRPESPQEVHVLRDAMVATLEEPSAIPVTVAINLHSSNSEPDTPAFFFPHFGPEELGYSPEEALLWDRSVSFMSSVEDFYGAGRIEPPPIEGGRGFTSNNFPESWWWHNVGADVMAITLETVYGRAGFSPRWVTPRDLRDLGRAVGLATLAFHGFPVDQAAQPALVGAAEAPVLAYPDLYPPAMEIELKAQ